MATELIAVTGAAGFIGRALLAHLQAGGLRAVGIVRGDTQGREDLVRADLTKPEDLAALTIRPTAIVHLAGAIHIALNPHGVFGCAPAQQTFAHLYESNVVATARVAEFALRHRARLVFASSQTVYGFGANGMADEETPLRPLEHYAASKVAAELVVEMLSRQGVPVTIVRFPGVFAPERKQGFVHTLCASAVRERRVDLEASMPLPFDVLALADVVEGISHTLFHAGKDLEKFNLSTGEPNSRSLLAGRISRLAGGLSGSEPYPPDPTICLRAERAAEVLSWRAQPMDARLREMLQSIES